MIHSLCRAAVAGLLCASIPAAPAFAADDSPTKGMDYRTAMLDINAREAFALFRLKGDLRYHSLGTCLEAQKRTKLDFYSAVALCRNYSGMKD